MRREWLLDQFGLDFGCHTIQNALTTLVSRGYLFAAPYRSLSCTRRRLLEIRAVMGDDFGTLYDYIEETFDCGAA